MLDVYQVISKLVKTVFILSEFWCDIDYDTDSTTECAFMDAFNKTCCVLLKSSDHVYVYFYGVPED